MIHLMGVDHARSQRKQRGLSAPISSATTRSLVESAIESIHPDLLGRKIIPVISPKTARNPSFWQLPNPMNPPCLRSKRTRATQMALGYKNVDMSKPVECGRHPIKGQLHLRTSSASVSHPRRDWLQNSARYPQTTSFCASAIFISAPSCHRLSLLKASPVHLCGTRRHLD